MSVASQGATYVPPFAKTTLATATAVAGAATTSFARLGTLPGASTQTSSAASSVSTSIVDENGGVDSNSLLAYFTIPYLDAHSLSPPSWRYAYIFWMVLAGLLVIWSIAYQFSAHGHGGLGAAFRKWSIRRAVVGGRRGQDGGGDQRRTRMRASPTVAQMLAIAGLIALCFCLSLIGDDYISPTTCTFGGTCPYQYAYGNSGGPPKSSYGGRLLARFMPPITKQYYGKIIGAVSNTLDKRGVNNPNGWAPFNDPLLSSPNYNIFATWWTAADRLGLITYAMFPLSVTLAVKQWPFNIWATPFLTGYHFDKTAILHRWSGRVIWLFSTAHTAAWCHELIEDKDPFGRSTFIPVLQFWRFRAGLVAYGLLCVIVLFSFNPIRTRFYELFYWSHVLLVALFLAALIIHGHALMWWPIVALAIWGAERLTRLIIFTYVNAVGTSAEPEAGKTFSLLGVEKVERYSTEAKAWDAQHAGTYPPNRQIPPESGVPGTPPPGSRQSYYAFGPGQDTAYLDKYHYPKPRLDPHSSSATSHSPLPTQITNSANQSPPGFPSNSAIRATAPKPPPGFALAQLLPGRTVRLTLVTPRRVRWLPGQHVFLTIPSVKLFQAHPYTILSVDERSKSLYPSGRVPKFSSPGSEIVMLIRAQKGFSKALWDHVVEARRANEVAGTPGRAVNLRSMISWPIGSSARVSWERYESLLIICGGTGITFGISVLENACRRMAAEKVAGSKKAYKTTRVRFVWILREHAHLSWVSSTIRRCLEMSNSSQLQVDLFVSRSTLPSKSSQNSRRYRSSSSADDFAPPTAPFARPGMASRGSMDSDVSDSESELQSSSRPNYRGLGLEDAAVESVTDFVLFDGEEDVATPELSSKIEKEGKVRRATSRRAQGFTRAFQKGTSKPQPTPTHSQNSSIDLSSDQRHTPPMPNGHFQPHGGRHFSSNPYGSYADTGSSAELGGTPGDEHSEAYSMGGSVRHLMGSTNSRQEDLDREGLVDLSRDEWEDLDLIAELARPGHPKLSTILDEEIAKSQGTTLVACCGPTELNTVVRHLVSSRIKVGQALLGNPKGSVSLVVEDFSY